MFLSRIKEFLKELRGAVENYCGLKYGMIREEV